ALHGVDEAQPAPHEAAGSDEAATQRRGSQQEDDHRSPLLSRRPTRLAATGFPAHIRRYDVFEFRVKTMGNGSVLPADRRAGPREARAERREHEQVAAPEPALAQR